MARSRPTLRTVSGSAAEFSSAPVIRDALARVNQIMTATITLVLSYVAVFAPALALLIWQLTRMTD